MNPVACVPYREARWLRDTNEPVTLKHTHTHTHGRAIVEVMISSHSCWVINSHTHTRIHTNTHTDTWFTQTPPHTYRIDTYTLSVSLSLSLYHTHTHTCDDHQCPTRHQRQIDRRRRCWAVTSTRHTPWTTHHHRTPAVGLHTHYCRQPVALRVWVWCLQRHDREKNVQPASTHNVIFRLSCHLENGTMSLKLVWMRKRFCHAEFQTYS